MISGYDIEKAVISILETQYPNIKVLSEENGQQKPFFFIATNLNKCIWMNNVVEREYQLILRYYVDGISHKNDENIMNQLIFLLGENINVIKDDIKRHLHPLQISYDRINEYYEMKIDFSFVDEKEEKETLTMNNIVIN